MLGEYVDLWTPFGKIAATRKGAYLTLPNRFRPETAVASKDVAFLTDQHNYSGAEELSAGCDAELLSSPLGSSMDEGQQGKRFY